MPTKSLPVCLLVLALSVFASGCSSTSTVVSSPVDASYDFGEVAVSQTATRAVYTLENDGLDNETVSAALRGNSELALAPGLSCAGSLAPGGRCEMAVTFSPVRGRRVGGLLTLTTQDAAGTQHKYVHLTAAGMQLSSGESIVASTANPVVATYTYQPDLQGTVAVRFGLTTGYGLTTGAVATPAAGGPVTILVAGMEQKSSYHMQAVVTSADGTVVQDADHVFTTGSFPEGTLPVLQTATTPGMTPQPGIELADATVSTNNPDYLEAYATDLSGNIIWGYNFVDRPTVNTLVQPIKLLPNGNMLLTLSFASQYTLPGQGVTLTPADESVDLIREIDLAGDPVAQITIATLNAKLAAAGYNITLQDIHHDLLPLPNGHIILIASTLKAYTDLPGYPVTTNVLGDVLVDLDTSFNIAWVWNEFDHLDINRHPTSFPDWTHTNALLYSPTDGNLLVSMRHQSWIVKVDYDNGLGAGDILWHLGEGGDFTLIGGTDPQDWFYGQHQPSFFSDATSGVFSLAMMDNGFNRLLANGTNCGSTAEPCYTTVPVVSVDESARTATLVFRTTLPPAQYSVFGGGSTRLANGDLEYDLCADPLGTASKVVETTVGANPQTVWTMNETGANLYRANRIPSLYPGVQW